MMNTYTNGTCALQFPSNYVLMDAEEMEYVDGGKYYGVNLSAKKCSKIADDLTDAGGILQISAYLCTGIAFIPGLQSALAGSAFFSACSGACSIGSFFFSNVAKRCGAYIGYDSNKNKIVYGYGTY